MKLYHVFLILGIMGLSIIPHMHHKTLRVYNDKNLWIQYLLSRAVKAIDKQSAANTREQPSAMIIKKAIAIDPLNVAPIVIGNDQKFWQRYAEIAHSTHEKFPGNFDEICNDLRVRILERLNTLQKN